MGVLALDAQAAAITPYWLRVFDGSAGTAMMVQK
jgi:hypothetical protein